MIKRISCLVLSVAALTACGEKAQTLGTKNDASAYSGAANSFVDAGWTAGDKTSWEQHLRARGQYGMNDHTRAP
jgi:major membrane immunogen (membrane-anchored lipoprotein)